MNKLHSKEAYDIENEVIRVNTSRMLRVLKLLSQGKSMDDVEEMMHIKKCNLYRSLKKFREKDYPIMSMVVDTIRNERLLEKGESPSQKMRQTKIKKAEQGYYIGPRVFGYMVKNGILIETKDIEKRRRVLEGFREGKSKAELARELDLSVSIVEHILSNPINMGEYLFMGKTYKITQGNFKPLLKPEEYYEIQSMIPPKGSGGPRVLFYWKDGAWVPKLGAKEKVEEILERRKRGESFNRIAGEMKLGRWLVAKVIKDRSLFKRLVDLTLWEAAHKVHVPSQAELQTKAHIENKEKLMRCIPAYRWEIRAKTGLSVSTVNSIVQFLRREDIGMLKERKDGLLQKSWEPFPEKVLSTQRISLTKKRKKILEVLIKEGEIKTHELVQKTGINKDALRAVLKKMWKQRILESRSSGSWGGHFHRIRDEFNDQVKRWLSQPHIASL